MQNDDVTPTCIDGITVPWRLLGSAVPVSTRVLFFPPDAAISTNLRSQILAGNRTNLVKILVCSEFSDSYIVDCGDVSVMLKDSYPHLSKTLIVWRLAPKICVPETNLPHERRKEKIYPSMPVNIPELGKALKKHPNRCFVN